MGHNEVQFFRAGYVSLADGSCWGENFNDGYTTHSQAVVVDYYRVTLESFTATQVDGITTLPYSKTTSETNGYDIEVGAFFSDFKTVSYIPNF